MAHPYDLHVDVLARCSCCQSQQTFRFASASDHVVCAACVHHLGAEKAERRDREHIRIWSAQHDELTDALAAAASAAESAAAESADQIAGLTATVAQLNALVVGEFDQAEPGGVRAELESELVKRAERKTALAFRKLDRVMAALWRLAQLHHDDPADAARCSCGRPASTCAEWRIAQSERAALAEWEAQNLGLLEAGARHALPPEHPAVGVK